MLLLRGTSHHNHHDHGHHHHHGKGGCKKSNTQNPASHGHGCGSEYMKCETKKDECGLEAECGLKCRAMVTEQNQSEKCKCCSSEAKTECCADAHLIHRDKDCWGEKDEKDCCGEVDDCCDDTGADAPHHHHHYLEDEKKVCESKCEAAKCQGLDISDKHAEEKSSKSVEESIIVVEEIQDAQIELKSHTHSHKATKCCEAKKAILTTNSSHFHKPHCTTDKPVVLLGCKKPHEETHSKNSACCNKKIQEAPSHCQPSDSHSHSLKQSPEIDFVHACKSLGEKREMGGCCKSYRKECCAHNKPSHFGKGLSEVVIE